MSTIVSGECFVSEEIVLDQPAPDFSAEAYYKGDKRNIKLSDFRNKWVVLFFYKADFTFV